MGTVRSARACINVGGEKVFMKVMSESRDLGAE